MVKTWKFFALGALSMLVLIIAGYLIYTVADKNLPDSSGPTEGVGNSNTVTIMPLPSLRIIRGTEVPFEGKTELRQAIAGRAARNLVIVNFQATGEHADKSFIKIVWENGEMEKVYPGTPEKKFAEDRRAVEISVTGYSMHERQILRDSSRKGTLTWEIRYEPVD
jgi:hypothetical protein